MPKGAPPSAPPQLQPGIPHSEETEAAVLALGARAISQRRSTFQINEGIVSPASGRARLEAPGRTEPKPGVNSIVKSLEELLLSLSEGALVMKLRGSTQPRSAASHLAGAEAAAAGPRKGAAQSEEGSGSTIENDPYRHALQTELTKTRKRVEQFEKGLSMPSPDESLEALLNRVVDYRNKPLQECRGKLAKTFKRILNMEMRLQQICSGATEPVVQQRWQPLYIHEIKKVLEMHQENPEACLSRLRKRLRRRVGEESDHPPADSDIWLYVRVIRDSISSTKDLEHYLATCLQPMAGHGEGRQAPDRPLLIPTQQNKRGGAAGGRAAHTPVTRDMEEVPRSQSGDDDNRVAGDRPSDQNPAAGPLASQRSHQPPTLDNRQPNPSPVQAINAQAFVAGVLQGIGHSTGSLPSSTVGPPASGPPVGGPSGASAGGAAGVQIDDDCSRARGWKYRPGVPQAGGISPAGSTPPAGGSPPAANIGRPAGTRPVGSVDPTRNIRPASKNLTIGDIAEGDPLISGDTMHNGSRNVRARRDGAATAAAADDGVTAAVLLDTSSVAAAAPAPATLASSESPAQSLRPTNRGRKRKAPERVIK